MPPPAVKTIRDAIYWQYAKLISKSAGFGLGQRDFQMATFLKLRDGKMVWSSTIREWILEHERSGECVYCSSAGSLTTEHILPLSCGGPDIPDNAIRVCSSCNSKKGGKRLYEWFTLARKDAIPRIAEGKYLKLLYQLHERAGTLNLDKSRLAEVLCPGCSLKSLCKKEGREGEPSVYCLEGGGLGGRKSVSTVNAQSPSQRSNSVE